MTIQEVINAMLNYHPNIGERKSGDGIYGGDPNVECTGIAVSISPTVDVIQRAIKAGANFILVHESTFYSAYDWDSDWLNGNDVYEEKKKLLVDNNVVIYRNHDHIHAHKPDGIFTYLMKYLGWENYTDGKPGHQHGVKLPETTLGELTLHIKEAMGLDTIRYIGDPNIKVSTVGFCGHMFVGEHNNWSNYDSVKTCWDHDVVIPGETVDWTVPLYIYDAMKLGKCKGMIIPGHFVQEELGMKGALEWYRALVGDELPILFIPAGDMYSYM